MVSIYLYTSPERLTNNQMLRLTNSDPISGINLHEKVEQGLDEGAIIIIPIPSNEASITKWKCLLLDTERQEKALCWLGGRKEIEWRVSIL
jgi:hypothetical protein